MSLHFRKLLSALALIAIMAGSASAQTVPFKVTGGGEADFVEADYAFRCDVGDGLRPVLAGFLDIRAVLLGGVDRFFLKVNPRRRSMRQTVRTETGKPSRSRISPAVRPGCSVTNRRMRSAWAANRGWGPRRPPGGASDPVSR